MCASSTNKLTHPVVVHSSIADIRSQRSDFPDERPMIGLIVRFGQHISGEQKADVCCYDPVITDVCTGELMSTSEVDGHIRTKLLSMAEKCREHAQELMVQAERLESIACQDEILEMTVNSSSRVQTIQTQAQNSSKAISSVSSVSANLKNHYNQPTGNKASKSKDLSYLNDIDIDDL